MGRRSRRGEMWYHEEIAPQIQMGRWHHRAEMWYPEMSPLPPQDNYWLKRQETGPVEPIQQEIQSMQQQTPIIQINVRFEKDAPETPIIEPSVQSVKALANWYRENGITPQHIPISWARIWNNELPPLYSQKQNFNEAWFRKWAEWILWGPGAVTMDRSPHPGGNWNNIELDILRKVYGNLGRIEQVRHLKEEKDITTGAIKNLNKMRLDQKLQEVLDERFGDPLEFKEDIQTINTMIDDEKEHGYLSAEAIDYCFWCVLNTHIMNRGFKISTIDNQPVIETGNPNQDAQWKSTLATLHFGGKTGSPLTAADNQSKIADYIAAYTYHNIDKNLTGHFTTLSQKAIGTNPDTTLTEDIIKNAPLTNEEKTFLSQWVGKEERLWDIQIRQREYVERARENTRGKSWETIKKDFWKGKLSTIMEISPVAGLAMGAVLIWVLVRYFVGEGKLSKFSWAIAAILWGVAIYWNIKNAEKLWGELAGENIANGATQAPRETNAISEMPDFFRDKWNSVSAFFSTSNDWSELMLDERIGPKLVDKYPTGAILAVLNPDPDNEYNEKWKWTPTQEVEIKKILEKLDGDEREKLNTMLTETWKKYIDANPAVTNAQLKNGTIQQMIDSLDTNYGWFNTAIRPAYWFDEESKEETLIEFTKNPTGWKEAKIGDLMTIWFWLWQPGAKNDIIALNRVPASSAIALVNSILPLPGTNPATGNNRTEAVKKTIVKIWEANGPGCDPEKTLGELLAKED
jgi:hypothetical protein